MTESFGYKTGKAVKALEIEGYYVWDCSVIEADGKYHMFSSRWKKELGFGWNWLFNSEIIHSVAVKPQGPYEFQNVVFPRRGRQYFDGMNTHNTCIKCFNDRFYLYYMGCTYGIEIPHSEDVPYGDALEVWNKKRIGLGVSEDINGVFLRRDTPLLEPRNCSFWDCTATTNPTVAILPNGKTYMIYKSRSGNGRPLKLGVAVADSPDGEFKRICDTPIFNFKDQNIHIEDPFLWYDKERKKFCVIAKDDTKNGAFGITGEWGSGFYAESDDCIHFEIAKNPKAYSRNINWADGRNTIAANLERPSLLFDKNGVPTHLFCASGNGNEPYQFKDGTFIICIELKKK